MATKYRTDAKIGVVKRVKGKSGLWKTPRGKIVSDNELSSTYVHPGEEKLRLQFKREKFNYDVAMPTLPSGLEFRIRVVPEHGETVFRLDVVDKETKKILVTSEPRQLPLSKNGFKAVVPEMVDEMIIPTYNPLELIRGQ